MVIAERLLGIPFSGSGGFVLAGFCVQDCGHLGFRIILDAGDVTADFKEWDLSMLFID